MMESRIKPLPEDVAARIAAGEVVERPASVVKELIENALDAGSTAVDIAVEAGGKGLIRVADDGCGMGREDAILALQQHTTSKISSIEDLDRLSTLGFRGEALFAISSVSRFSLLTRREEDSTGTRIWVEDGEVEVSEAPRQRGTTVEVRDLFYNLPARRRFLRSNNTELSHVVKVVEWYLLTNPQLGVSLISDEREIFSYPPSQWKDRVISHWEVAGDSLASVEFKAPGIEIKGFATLPPLSFKNRSRMVFSVNGHPVQDSLISAAVREAMDGIIPKGEYPGLLLVITLPPSQVDVNVHPAKREVRFRNGQLVFTAVLNALNRVFEKGSVGPEEEATSLSVSNGRSIYWTSERSAEGPRSFSGFNLTKAKRPSYGRLGYDRVLDTSTDAGWRCLGEIEGVYLLFEAEDGALMVVDKHACHERMLYDEIVKGEYPSIPLLVPVQFSLTPEELDAAETQRELIESLGFSFEIAGDKVSFNAVPSWAKNRIAEAFKRALALKGESSKREVLARWACREAVKAGEPTGLMEVEAMAKWLQAGGEELTCPHGRPIVVRLTRGLLDRLFKRRM